VWAFSGLGHDHRAFTLVRKSREKNPAGKMTFKRNCREKISGKFFGLKTDLYRNEIGTYIMITLTLSAVSLVIYIFMTGYSEGNRGGWACASLMAFNWLLSEIQLYGLRH
jgi:hypothetical protein